jgi:hypothetical protein
MGFHPWINARFDNFDWKLKIAWAQVMAKGEGAEMGAIWV